MKTEKMMIVVASKSFILDFSSMAHEDKIKVKK